MLRVGAGGGWVGVVSEHVPLVEFMSFVFTRMPGESYCIGDSGLCYCVCDFFNNFFFFFFLRAN